MRLYAETLNNAMKSFTKCQRLSPRFSTRGVVVLHQIHPAAHFISPYQRRVERLQHFADGVRFLEARVEPEVIGIIRQNDGHAVMNIGEKRVRHRGDDGAGLDQLPLLGILPWLEPYRWIAG